MSATLEEERLELEEGIRLMAPEPDQMAADMPIRWCISKELAERLKDRNIKQPKLLLVVTHGTTEMSRHLVPLMDEMRYFQFKRPGRNVVHAKVVWDEGPHSAKHVLFDTNQHGDYRCSVTRPGQPTFNRLRRLRDRTAGDQLEQLREEIEQHRNDPEEAELRSQLDGFGHMPERGELAVDVDREMFAGEPNRVLQWLASRLWESRPEDQCHVRRRALIVLALSPLLSLVAAAYLLLTEAFNLATYTALKFLGRRNVNASPLRHPFRDSSTLVWEELKPSVWTHQEVEKEWGSSYKPRSFFFWVVNPPALVAGTALAIIVWSSLGSFTFNVVTAALAVTIGAVVVTVAGLLAVNSSPRISDRAEKFRQDREYRKKQAEQEERDQRTRELESLACTAAERPVSVMALPKHRQTVSLRFHGLKSRVCKPFAR